MHFTASQSGALKLAALTNIDGPATAATVAGSGAIAVATTWRRLAQFRTLQHNCRKLALTGFGWLLAAAGVQQSQTHTYTHIGKENEHKLVATRSMRFGCLQENTNKLAGRRNCCCEIDSAASSCGSNLIMLLANGQQQQRNRKMSTKH